MEEAFMIKIDNVSKQYRLGQISGTTLRDELQRRHAKFWGKEDPTKIIGSDDRDYGETFLALDHISLAVKPGERVGIIGHNGAGKSTLLKLISKVTAPSSGTIDLDGRVASMLEVGTGFHMELTGRENIYMNGAILGMTKKEIEAKMDDIIDFSEVRQFIDTPVKRYSSGMYVKLAFSVAAHLSSEIMIMDEVLAVGDMAFQNKCLEKMNHVSRSEGRTILYVSHNMHTIRQLCERCVVLDHGQIIFDGDVEKAIAVYLNRNANEFKTRYELEDLERAHHFGKNVLMTDFQFDGKESPVFDRGEPMHFTVKYKMRHQTDALRFLFHIQTDNGFTVGLTQSYTDIPDCEPGKTYQASVTLDISNLAPGKYYFSPEIVSLNEYGNYLTQDIAPVDIRFEMDGQFKNSIRWEHCWFGNVMLNPLVLNQVHQID